MEVLAVALGFVPVAVWLLRISSSAGELRTKVERQGADLAQVRADLDKVKADAIAESKRVGDLLTEIRLTLARIEERIALAQKEAA